MAEIKYKKGPENVARIPGFDAHAVAPIGAKNPENPPEAWEAKSRLFYGLYAPLIKYSDKRMIGLLEVQIKMGVIKSHADLTQFLWDSEVHEHSRPPLNLLEKWSKEIDNIIEVTRTEESEGIDVEEKRYLFTERKKHLWKQGLTRKARKMIDDGIWNEHREKFERFIDGGIGYGDITKELDNTFLEIYERNSPMQGFVLGVGENKDLEKIYWRRRDLVNEARDTRAQMLKRGEEKKTGSHFASLEEHEQEEIKRLFSNEEKFGKTDDLLRAIRKVYRTRETEDLAMEGGDMAKGIEREDYLFEMNDYNELFNDAGENSLGENYRNQLNERAKEMFGEFLFTDLSGSEQKVVMVGTGESLSHTEIMRWMKDYRVEKREGAEIVKYGIRISEEPHYGEWTRKGLVKKQGLWLLADMQNAMINSFGARPEIRSLEKRTIDGQQMQGMGKYRMFDVRLWEVFYGPRGWVLEEENKNKSFNGYKQAEKDGGLQILLKGFENEAQWAGGLWQEWKAVNKADHDIYIKEIKAAEISTGQELYKPSLEDYIWNKVKERGFESWAQEMYASGWKLLAEKVFMQLRGEWIVQKAMLGLEHDKLLEALSGDKMGMKIGPYGEKELIKLYEKESKGLLTSVIEWGKMRLILGKNSLTFRESKKLGESDKQKITEQKNKARYRVLRESLSTVLIKPHKFLRNRSGIDVLAMVNILMLGLNIAPKIPVVGLLFSTPMFSTMFRGLITGAIVPWLRGLISVGLLSAKAPLYKWIIFQKIKAADATLAKQEEMAEKYTYAVADNSLRGLIKTTYTEGFSLPKARKALAIISEHDK